ncbi:efflux RND transporter permease subunit [Nannocystis bainbridge]|uniref:Efflux RND transporter permease subunit n=1 Tax=Nannocystis bainbridge TaxID=2995303 RepID=A0ABT5DW30_9BACT|nr:efflux RND transporter permease subunit [Nannocystis bainbridge]MDC0717358.1 efflux RND transporter permease subunit [Nannocystis bainbridge]
MTLSEICVRRPVFTLMLILACVTFGVLSFRTLGVDQFPDVEIPVVTVTTTLRGASPEEIETQVSKIVEDAVSTAEGIDELRSTSLEGVSVVTINFLLDRDRDQATQDVRDKVAAALKNLPEGTDPPVVTRFDTTAIPVITLVVSSDRRDLREVTEMARKQVLEPLQGVAGVGQIQLVGGQRRAFNVLLDADALAAQGLSIQQVRQAIEQQNLELPGGRLESSGREEVLRTMARVQDARELRRLVVAERQGAPVVLGQIAEVEDSTEDPRSLSRLDGENAVALVVQKQAGTNTVEVVDSIFKRIGTLQRGLPADIEVTPIRDASRFIRRSIHEVELHLVLGALLASVSVLLFMGSIRSTLIAALAIPCSIITTFAVLRALDYTLNNFTLLALTLAVGIVIDDAIVVLENVYRRVEHGEPPVAAAIAGTREITLAVFATTLSLIVIFLPTAFMEGRVGRFWRSFGITTAFSIAVSLFVSLTLTPMLCARLLKPPKPRTNAKPSLVARLNDGLDRGYAWLVRWSLQWRWLVVAASLATVATVVPLGQRIGKDFIPKDDTSEFMVVLTMPEGSSLAASSAMAARIEGHLRELRGVERMFTSIGAARGGDDVTEVQIYVQVIDIEKRDYPLMAVQKQAREALRPYPDLRPSVQDLGGMGGGGRNTQLAFSLRGPDLDQLGEYTATILAKMREIPGLVDIDSSAAVRKPEVRVKIDRDRAADLGVRAGEIAAALRTMVGGEPISKIREGAEQYDLWLRLRPEDRRDLDSLRGLPMQARGGLIRLEALAEFERERGPAQIDRLGRIRQVEIGANLDGLPLGDAVDRVKAMVATLDLPPEYEVVFSGRAKTMSETITSFLGALALSFLFMYMVLAAQFESLLHPVTIMLSLPLSLPFALLSLMLLGDTLNIYSTFGVFMLFGIIKKNGILQVDYTNTLRARGEARDVAIVEANKTRLRPILMTTITLIAGMIPIALGKGPGAASRASMAKVIIGGQALSLLITLLIVPVAYSLFDDAGTALTRLSRRLRGQKGEG